MTDKKFHQLKKQVNKITDEWVEILGLRSHRIRYRFIREYHATKETIALAFPLWEYKTATIEFYMPSIAEVETDDELEEDILHELCHILIASATGNTPPEHDAERAAHEMAVQQVVFGLRWAREAGAKDAKV